MWKVSLLVTTYNVADNLPITLESIAGQDYGRIEVVIVDGVSTDGTVPLIEAFASRYAAGGQNIEVTWVSEKDNGLYDAMNKAYALSTGDIIAVCNDRFCAPDAISKLVKAIENEECAGNDGTVGNKCIGAHADLVYAQGERVVRTWHMGQGHLQDGWMPGHPTLFLKREVYEHYGVYDTSYRCAADYEFMVRFLKDEDNRLAYVPEVLISMFYGGTSNAGLGNYLVSFREGYHGLKKNGVKHPLLITIRRTFLVLGQFRAKA